MVNSGSTHPNILGATPLMRAGWDIILHDGPTGSRLVVPGCPRPFPLSLDARGNIYLTLVKPRDAPIGTFDLYDPGRSDQANLFSALFLLDTGAELSVLCGQAVSYVAGLDTVPLVPIAGVDGSPVYPRHSGVLTIRCPPGATVRPTPGSTPDADVPPAVRYTTALHQTTILRVRNSAFPAHRDAMLLAQRLNLRDGAAYRAFRQANPYGIADNAPWPEDTADFSQGLHYLGAGRRPPAHHQRHVIAATLRNYMPPGHVWWTDISLQRLPDFAGNTFSRLFAEENTTFACTYYSARKDSSTLIAQLDEHAAWVAANVPGGRFTVLRCDFASEIVRQGHGDDIYTQALSRYCDANPHFRVVPCPPHSQAFNRAENTWGRIHGGAHINALRARLGPAAWSIAERGAVFQHNHTPAPRSRSSLVAARTRAEALTLTIFDASTMLGFVGQTGWVHCHDAKSSAFRPSAEPVLYVCPATALSAQIVFNLRSFKLNVVADVSFSSDAKACSLLLARSALYRPRGDLATPEADAYTARLQSLLAWLPDDSTAAVNHDPVIGLPTSITQYVPRLASDGSLLMLAPDELHDRTPDAAPHAPRAALAPAAPIAASEGVSPAPQAAQPLRPAIVLPPAPPAAPPAPPLARAPPGNIWAQLPRSSDVKADIAYLMTNPDTLVHFKPGRAKRGASARRWDTYSAARSFSEFKTLHAGVRQPKGPSYRQDLTWDLTHDLARFARPHVRLARAPIDDEPTPDILWDLARDERRPTRIAVLTADDHIASLRDEQAALNLIASYEPMPPAGHPLHPDTSPVPEDVSGLYSAAHAAGSRVLRVALQEDMPTPLPVDLPDRVEAPDPEELSFPLYMTLHAAPAEGTPTPPSSVAAARRLPDFAAPHGWRDAITKEVRRVEGFRAWALAPASAVKRAVAEVGHERVSIGHIVAVLTCKLDPAGDPRAPGILNKFRVAIADRTDATSGVPTFSSCVDDVTNRIITAVAPAVRATQTTIDVGGAYYHGTPDSVEAGGRYLFARIPPWLSDLFPDAYPATDALGRHNFLRILGNMPGRCDAGRIWQRRFDVFLRGYGLTQLMTDRRTWVRTTDEGTLIVHDHVDDSRLTSTTDAVRDAFHRAWAETFGEPLGATPQSEDFTGLRHHRIDARTTAVSCEGIILRLQRELEPFPLSTNESCNWPLSALAFTRLRAQPAPIAERANTEHLRTAATLLGIIGFITALVRADGYFAYAVLCRFATPDRLSPLAFRCIIRLGHYLVATRRLALHLTAPAPSSHSDGAPGLDLFDTYADASNGNWDSGSGFAGFVLTTRRDADQPPLTYGGGALAWRAHAVRAGDDSSGAAELRSAATAYKYTLSARLLQAELRVDIAPTRPTKFYLDATSVLDGFDCERLTKNTRWMAMRYAMLRWGTACKSIEPIKLPSADNPADAFTKCLTGPHFVRARAFLLGYPLGDPPPVPQGTAPAPLA
jgi:hypothetical protein